MNGRTFTGTQNDSASEFAVQSPYDIRAPLEYLLPHAVSPCAWRPPTLTNRPASSQHGATCDQARQLFLLTTMHILRCTMR